MGAYICGARTKGRNRPAIVHGALTSLGRPTQKRVDLATVSEARLDQHWQILPHLEVGDGFGPWLNAEASDPAMGMLQVCNTHAVVPMPHGAHMQRACNWHAVHVHTYTQVPVCDD